MTNGNNLIVLEQRQKLLAGITGLAALPVLVLKDLAARLIEERHAAGSVVVREGEAGNKLYFVAAGQAEASTFKASGAIPLETLEIGEMFGEIPLLSFGTTQHASVTALTELVTLSLSKEDFNRLLDSQPQIREVFQRAADDMVETVFLKRASPFAKIESAQLWELSKKLDRVSYKAGENIITPGDAGNMCYFLFAGKVEVFLTDAGETAERRLASLGAGALFGESALLTHTPRCTTVRALEDSQLLRLRRADLLAAMSNNRQISRQMFELVQLRARPRRRAGNVIERERTNAEGETITILKDVERRAYYRLSREGYFIWQRLDGKKTLRDLTLDYLAEFKSFSPHAIAEVVIGLTAAGFVEAGAVRADVLTSAFRLEKWEKAVLTARQILEWQRAWAVDTPVSWLYRKFLWLFYTRFGQILLGLITFFGLAAFFSASERAKAAVYAENGASLLLFLFPAYAVVLLVHECGHAFTTKAFGYEVPRAGIGWYWFSPIAFVDTSDMWLGTRWQRIAVSLGGPYSNLILGSAASIIAWFSGDAVVTTALWQMALISYSIAVLNFNPLLEYDGYYILADWLERPNLRPKALAWLGGELPRVWRERAVLRAHLLELVYGTASLIYIFITGVLVIVFYRLLVQDWMARIVPPSVAAALAWILGAGVMLLCILKVVGELRGTQQQSAE